MTTISEPQFQALRAYLDEDAAMHIAASGKWRLDAGKLEAALDEAGIEVSGSTPLQSRYAVAAYGEKAGNGFLGEAERLSIHVVEAKNAELARATAALERGDALGSFDQVDLLEAGHLMTAVERL